jgi:hypothetical protein
VFDNAYDKMKAAIRDAAVPSLGAGEVVQIEALGTIGQVSASKMVATATVTAVLTLGTVSMWTKPRALFMALTNERLLFLEPSVMSGKPTTKVVLSIPRSAVIAVECLPKRVLGVRPTVVVDLVLAGQEKAFRLQFGPWREAGTLIADALRTSPLG